MTTLPHLFPVVYGGWTWVLRPVCALLGRSLLCLLRRVAGVGLAALTGSGLTAIALMLLWAGVVEDAIALIPNGMTVQQYMPFLNGIYGTGQWLALTPPWGRSGALGYFALLSVAFLAAGIAAAGVRRRRA